MRVPRATFGASRTVSDPDGRTWTVRVEHYRLPPLGEDEDDLEVSVNGPMEAIRPMFWWRLVALVPIAFVVWRYGRSLLGAEALDRVLFLVIFVPLGVVVWFWSPLLDATIGHRPWIVATAEHPPARMVWRVWRVTGRNSVSEAVD